MKRITIIPFIILIGFMSSCDYLNVEDYFEDTFSADSIFASQYNLERYFNGAVNLLPNEGDYFENSYTPGITGSDEAISTGDHPTSMVSIKFRGTDMFANQVTPDALAQLGDFTLDIWPKMYKIIRKANTILARLDEVPDISVTDKKRLRAETRFLRAYAYYHLLHNFGPFILLGDKIYDTNETPEYYAAERGTFDECVDYICDEMEACAPDMEIKQPVNRFGRPTKGAALGLVARLRLEQASPLFNGGDIARKYYNNWVRKSDGAHYISQTYDEKRWAVAAHAAKRVIDMGIYKLYTVPRDETTPPLPASVPSGSFPDGAGDIDAYKSYSYLFNGNSLAHENPEYVFARVSDKVKGSSWFFFPQKYDGFNCVCIPQRFIDAYYMADGKDYRQSTSEFPYVEKPDTPDGLTQSDKQFSGYTLKAGTSRMYDNREMRFYASIGFSNCLWPMISNTNPAYTNIVVSYALDGNAGKNSGNYPGHYNLTGYVCKKYIGPSDGRTNGKEVDKIFPIMRYAEILLSYAEALNNLTQTHEVTDSYGNTASYSRNAEEIRRSFNQIRFRAALPGLTDAELSSASTVNDLIVRERMIEFLYENRRYYDIRRWGIIEELESQPIQGMNVEQTVDGGYYHRVIPSHKVIRERTFMSKMIFLPISRDEMRKVPSMDQNPGYDY